MLYTAMSRVRSASSLRILSGLGDKAVNVVDPELIRDADVDLIAGAANEDAPPTAPPVGSATATTIPPDTETINPTIPSPAADPNRPPSEHESELEDDVFIDDT
jgi:hypothetical protein